MNDLNQSDSISMTNGEEEESREDWINEIRSTSIKDPLSQFIIVPLQEQELNVLKCHMLYK